MNVTILTGLYTGQTGTVVGKSDVGSKDEVWMIYLASERLTLPFHPLEIESEEDRQRQEKVRGFMAEFTPYFGAQASEERH